jgi:hypothetical protein
MWVLCVHSLGAITLQLTPSPAPPQAVGTPITWTAVATGTSQGQIEYQFSGGPAAGSLQMLQDFSLNNQFAWAVTGTEGSYTLHVAARNRQTGETAVSQSTFTIASRLTGNNPVISPTSNPLVALYSAPGCPIGSAAFVRFSWQGQSSATNAAPCTPETSMNFYIGGMLPETTYTMSYVVVTGGLEYAGAAQEFTSGSIDPALAFPPVTIVQPAGADTAIAQPVLLLDYLSPPGGPYYFPTAVDLQGRTIWYYPALGVPAQNTTYFLRPVPNSQGHMLVILNDPNYTPNQGQILREIDLAGNTVAQTNATTVNDRLLALGYSGITSFNHDAIRLPNGHTLVISAQERIYPAGTQGAAGPVDIIGDAIVDLDQNWQVAWSWSAYDHLDIDRAAILGETCTAAQPGCPPLTLALTANDWLHGNSLYYIPDTGDILFSIRHQDWIVRIDYLDGNGTGNILWRMGADGDFSIASTDPYPWFSHQHDVEFVGGTNELTLFDNGNTRVALNPHTVENSRGYVLDVDEANLSVTPILLTDLGVYSPAVGTAQKLSNGDYHFHAGFVNPAAPHSNSFEVTPAGRQNYLFEDFTQTYRAYRMQSLYSVFDSQLDPLTPCSQPSAILDTRGVCGGGHGPKTR